ncbi:minichromosome maintenance complex protein [Nitzschia inconspicua]|uniref:DNA helicase n=1 Tax=Nitzschia inconspicua TaxID=303405 RepID=A0A9K3L5L4_9STRA|nr:minichromosome maintenance complex protein [Nitzschia inconspicua]
MATQGSLANDTEVVRNGIYPDYDSDIATFTQFVLGHTIRRVVQRNHNNNNEDSDDDDDNERMFEPTAEGDGLQVERVPCYPPLLQRIVDKDYMSDQATTFLIEVPLTELTEWDNTRGKDLAERATSNTLRYHSIFCSVMDDVLRDNIRPSNHQRRGRRHRNNNNRPANVNVNGTVLLRNAMDVLQEQRLALHRQSLQQQQNRDTNEGMDGDAANNGTNNLGNNTAAGKNDFPPLLMRRYELRILPIGRRGSFFPFHDQYIPQAILTAIPPPKGVSLRHVRSRNMGRLVTITGMVVKASDVKPMLQVAAYTCDVCGSELYRETNHRRDFMPERVCPVCAGGLDANNNNDDGRRRGPRRNMGILQLETRGSKFTKFQELKLQELPSQVPMGHVPRSLSVICRGELTRLANPGDVTTVDGIFLPQKVNEGQGYRGRSAGLMTTLFLDAQNIMVHKKSYEDSSIRDSLSEEEATQLDADLQRVATAEDPIGVLSKSIAPEIFGHADIKRALLLQLTGGVFRKMEDGMRIRGDINICLMGDPGVAKSQLLKHVASIAPRGVYTTGKGSSGVGLTAAITKDNMTGELSLEGGALVLADRGICAIDEFDKMDESDRTAIHEVMEQQTVSIAKAGIVATLNARASVLAAANPLYSRYNRHKSLSENINLPNSLLSRFDLMFLILDVPDVDRDMALARHVTFVHQNEGLEVRQEANEANDSDNDDADMNNNDNSDYDEEKGIVSPRLLREYISRARQHEPVVPPEVAPYIVEAYVSLRMQDRPGRNNRSSKVGDQTAMTARQLLSILRLGQALARLRFSDFVAREDVDEAIRLTHMSKASLTEDAGENGTGVRREDVMSRVFNIIRDYATTSNASHVEMRLAEAMVIRKGFTAQQLQACLEEYEALEVIQVNQSRTQIHFVS